MKELEKIATDLFDQVRTRFSDVTIGNEKAKAEMDPEKARFFNFNYTTKSGKELGNVTLSIVDTTGLKVYYGKDLTEGVTPEEQRDWFSFLKSLRMFAKRNRLSFDVRDITKSNLNLRDIKAISKSDSAYDSDEAPIAESKLYGNHKKSFQEMGPVRLLIKHSTTVDEEVRGSRTRNIESIFVETSQGERFLLPTVKLGPARALARHVSMGGDIKDEMGSAIVGIAEEMSNMGVFVRNVRHRVFEDDETQGMVEAAIERYTELKNSLHRIGTGKGYQQFAENFNVENYQVPTEFDEDELKERFVKKIFDDRLGEALPYVYRAYQQRQQTMEDQYFNQFNDWADQVTEGVWSLPNTEEKEEQIKDLFQSPIRVGENAADAIGAISNLVGADDLFDNFHDIAQDNPDADVRGAITYWLSTNGYRELASELDGIVSDSGNQAAQPDAGEGVDSSTVDAAQAAADAAAQKPTESIDSLRRLAGL